MTSAPGWYPDQSLPGYQRYWDGAAWVGEPAPLAPPVGDPRFGADPGYGAAPGYGANAPGYGAATGYGAAPGYAPAYGYPPTPQRPIGFVEAVRRAFQRYATFSGRARRSEYWWFYLFLALVLLPLYVLVLVGLAVSPRSTDASGVTTIDGVSPLIPLAVILMVAAALALFLPYLAVYVRRLHDTDKSGWWLLIGFVPFGGIVLFVFTLLESTPGPNRYGLPSE